MARGVISGKAEPAPQRVVMRQQAVDLAVEHLQIGEIHDADRAPADLVLIGRTDAASRGADTRQRACGFANGVKLLVQWQDQGCVLCNTQALRRDIDALGLKPVDFFDQSVRIDHDAVADDRELTAAHHA